ncbi:MAG: c-type cytochrome [Chitinophagaceae bacterium]
MGIFKRFFTASTVIFLLSLSSAKAQDAGETIFIQSCSPCHTIGKGKLVGPDLENVQERHTKEWIKSFIVSSQAVIQSGDKYADSLFKAFNQTAMPPHPNFTDEQLTQLISYISGQGTAPVASASDAAASDASAPIATASVPVLPGDSRRGQDLFDGKVRFTNRGAACNSCHNVEKSEYISGGALGKDLTHAITRLSASGVTGIVSGLPFPQMKETYSARPVTNQEIADVVAFLTEVDQAAPPDKASSQATIYLLAGGSVGIFLLLVLFALFWIKRKDGSVNLGLFNRQIKSA